MSISVDDALNVLPGFESLKSFWSPKWERHSVKVKPGEFYVSSEDMVISTVLGSCISVCIYDPVRCLGGMNHFMLPDTHTGEALDRPLRYGFFAMEQLVNELMKHECQRENMQVKVTGGARMNGNSLIGSQNIDFINEYVEQEGLNVTAIDVGGDQARQVVFFPSQGRMLVNKLSHREDLHLIDEEKVYRDKVDLSLDDTSVELF